MCRNGFTLVELMVALVIVTVGLLGLLHSVSVGTHLNLSSQLRDEAVQIADRQMTAFMALPFSSISTSNVPGRSYLYVPRQFPSRLRGAEAGTFTVTRSVNEIRGSNAYDDSKTKELVVTVRWRYRNISTAHEIHSLRADPG